MGGNFVSATPDTAVTEDALRSCELTVQVSTKLNRSHVVPGRTALILPALGRTERDPQADGEQFVTVEDSMSVVHDPADGSRPPASGCAARWSIVCRLARALLGPEHPVPWAAFAADYDVIRDHRAGRPRLRGLQLTRPRARRVRAAAPAARHPAVPDGQRQGATSR